LFGAGISNSASVDHQRCGLKKLWCNYHCEIVVKESLIQRFG
jgi:hypothetical protein